MKKTVLTVASAFLFSAIGAAAAPHLTSPRMLTLSGQDQQAQPNDPKAQTKIETFVGTIAKSGNQFVFSDEASRVSYQLDDQQTASKFDGKKVKVTGTLDAANMIIRVQSIEAA